MNKKILLLLVAVCMISAIAAFVYAGGTSCGMGPCAATTVTTINATTQVIAMNTTGTVTTTSLTLTAYCNTSVVCFNQTNITIGNCTDSTQMFCDNTKNIREYKNLRFNNATWNVTKVVVKTGSAPVVGILVEEAITGQTGLVVLPEGASSPNAVLLTSARDQTFTDFFIPRYNAISNELVITVAGTEFGESKVILATIELDSSNPRTPSTSQGGINTGVADPGIPTLPQATEIVTINGDDLFLAVPQTSNGKVMTVGLRKLSGSNDWGALYGKRVLSTFSSTCTGTFAAVDTRGKPLSPTGEYLDTEDYSGMPLYPVISNQDSAETCGLENNIVLGNVYGDGVWRGGTAVADPSWATDWGLKATGYADFMSSAITGVRSDDAPGPATNNYAFVTTVLYTAVSPAMASLTQVTTPQVGKTLPTLAAGDVRLYVPLNKDKILAGYENTAGDTIIVAFNSVKQRVASYQVSGTASAGVSIEFLGQNPGVYIAQIPNGTRMVVMQGSHLIGATEIYNFTADSGAILNAQATGGHSGDYLDFVLGGRSTYNNTYILLDYFNASTDLSAINPNGTTRFTTDKQVVIQTMHPDINILNFQLDFQAFNGTFDTSAGDCTNCSFDLDNTTCQAEVEKVWGMFQQYNLTMSLSTASAINLSNLTMYCRDANQTVTAHANCAGLFSTYGVGSTPCMVWVATPGRSWTGTFFGGTGLAIDLTGFTSANLTLGTMTPTATCEQIACEIRGTWQPGNTQEFTMNKTITVTAI